MKTTIYFTASITADLDKQDYDNAIRALKGIVNAAKNIGIGINPDDIRSISNEEGETVENYQ